jgi:segregation and condensation protein B
MSDATGESGSTTDAEAVEAALFIGAEPTTAESLELGEGDFPRIIDSLNARYERQRRPYRIEPDGDGWRLRLSPEHAEWVRERLRRERAIKLGRPTLEVLACIAYRQPISRAAIEALTNSDAGAPLRRLIRMRMVEPLSEGDESTFCTTPRFLEAFKLKSPADLPSVER